MSQIDEARKLLMSLPPHDRETLLREMCPELPQQISPRQEQVLQATPVQISEQVEAERFKDGRFCPHCHSSEIVRFGRQKDGKQRFQCKACKKTFQATTGTLFQGAAASQRARKLRQYIHCMALCLPLRQTAKTCQINLSTAFAWRHKVLDALAVTLENVVLDGIVEVDETFFALSFKGNRHMNDIQGVALEPRKRGRLKGVNDAMQVCVPTGVSRTGSTIGKASNLGHPSGADVLSVFKGHIKEGSVLCADGGRAYNRVAKDTQTQLQVIKGGKGTRGIYGIQRVNAMHNNLKGMINIRFRGVATKYLNNYVAWNAILKDSGDSLEDIENLLYEIITDSRENPCATKDLSDRHPIPVMNERQKKFIGEIISKIVEKNKSNKEKHCQKDQEGVALFVASSPTGADEPDIPF